MILSLDRIMLFVRDVEGLASFYVDVFGFERLEAIDAEWAVLKAGRCELALHRIGQEWRDRRSEPTPMRTNAKLVFSVEGDLAALRNTLLSRDIRVGDITSYPNAPELLCDGIDPEGNVFQLVATQK